MNLPNKLTFFRVVLVPVVILVWLFPYSQFDIYFSNFIIGNTSISILNLIVLIIFVIASLTDMLDGMIARKNNLITSFGKFFDPIADKLLVNSLLIIMAYKHLIPVVPVVLMLARDIIVDGARMVAANNNVIIAAGILGKLKTVLQIITICLVLLNNIPFELIGIPMTSLMIWFTTFVSLAGGYSYFLQVKSYIFKNMWGIFIFEGNNNIGGIIYG